MFDDHRTGEHATTQHAMNGLDEALGRGVLADIAATAGPQHAFGVEQLVVQRVHNDGQPAMSGSEVLDEFQAVASRHR